MRSSWPADGSSVTPSGAPSPGPDGVATNGGVPVDRGDEVRVRRRDESRSFETVRRVLLELREPGGDVVGHLVEVEED